MALDLLQVHIALSEEPSKMHVSWKTAGAKWVWWLHETAHAVKCHPILLWLATGFTRRHCLSNGKSLETAARLAGLCAIARSTCS